MPKIANFSKSQQILDTNDWESLRIVNEKSKTTALVSDKLREIVKRLLSKSDGQYNIDDFEFLVTDEDNQNAFYISDTNTKNNRHIVAVSSGLIDFCNSEDEFAGVIGHELGHFVYDKLSKSGKNTVFQERGSDLHSVDLVIDGGYDPLAYENIAKRIHLKYKGSILGSLGVHGNNFARVEDIRVYLTYLKKGKGEFKPSKKFGAGDWKVFQKQFNDYFPSDRFQSYLDQKMGTNLTQQNLEKSLDIIFDEIKYGNIEMSARLSDLESKFGVFRKKNPDYNPEQKITDKLQQIVEFIINKNPGKEWAGIISELHYINNKNFSLFGEFAEVAKDMQKFIDAKDITQAEEIAKKWGRNKIRPLQEYHRLFDFPSFVMPNEKDAIGKEFPFLKHMKWAKNNNDIKIFLNDAFRIDLDLKYLNDNYLTQTKWPDNKVYNYELDEDDKIFVTGQDAVDYNNKTREKHAILENQKKSEENHIRFTDQIDLLNALVDFDGGKKSASEFWQIFQHYHPNRDDPIYRILQNYYSKIRDNKYEPEDYNSAINSKAYDKFAKISDSLQLSLEETKQYNRNYREDENITNVFLDSIFRHNANVNFLKNITEALLKLIEQTGPNDGFSKVKLISELYDKNNFEFSGEIYSNSINSSKTIIKEAKQLQEVFREKIRDKYTDYADPALFFYDLKNNNIGLYIIDDQLKDNKETPLLDRIFQKAGVEYAKTPKQYADNKLKLIYQLRQYDLEIAMGYYLVRCLSKDLPIIDDLESFFDNNNEEPYISKAPMEQDELAKYIKRHDLFPKNNFVKAFKIYQHMESMEWFSKNESNQAKILDVLINNIKSMNVNDRGKYSMMLISGVYEDKTRKDSDLRFPNQKNDLMTIFTDSVYEKYGKDDGSDEYKERISGVIENIDKDIKLGNYTSRSYLSKPDKAKLFRLLSDKIVSQERLSQIFGRKRAVAVGDKDAQSNDIKARAFEGFLKLLEESPKRSIATIEFLNRKLTSDSMNKFRKVMYADNISTDLQNKHFNTEFLELVYNSFWTEELGFRTIVMNKLLNRISDKEDGDSKTKDQIAYVCDMHFPKTDKYRKDAEVIFETMIMAFEPFERSLILSAIASADENKDDEHQNAPKSVGAGLRMFFENMGPAWVKWGQLLSYVPELPSEIREDLGKLKDKADIPSRWELFNYIKSTLPNELQKNIISVDEILGAGSFWITAKIKYVDKKTGIVQDKVLSLLRPYALERSRSGFKIIEKAVGDLAKKDKKYKSLLKVAQQAKASSEYEVDVVYGNKQFEKAKELYGDISVNINGEKFTPNVMNWEYYGVGKDKVGYKIMELANGKTLDRASESAEEKRKMALAYVAIELTNLFKGDVWDIDRHMGQQNFEKAPDGNYNVNIYDTGAQMNKAPNKTDKILLAEVLYGLIRAARTGKSMDQQILNTIKNMDRLETYLKVDTNYVADVQKGLLALSDIMEYQKEIKDKDGNIIQKSLSLSAQDLANVIEAVYENPAAEKTIKTSLAGKVMLNKLRPLRRGWISSLSEGVNKKGENPIKIELKPFISETNSVNFDKPKSEILDIENSENSELILGVNKKFIKKPGTDIPMDVLSQIKLREIA